jgi:pyruvate/2-oxoglutarate dehydrogenase complex dihydrolipoamide acyltransferase (E2) component
MAQLPVFPPEYEEEGCSATLLFWYKREGEQVEEGDELAEIETAKSILTVVAPASGTMKQILIGEGEEVSAGIQLAVIENEEA